MDKNDNQQKAIAWVLAHCADQIQVNEDNKANLKILHEAWCSIWYKQVCDCEPEIWIGTERIHYPTYLLTQE